MLRGLCLTLLLAACVATADEAGSGAANGFIAIDSIADLEQQLEAANGAPVLLNVYAWWGISAVELHEQTFPDENVQKLFEQIVTLQVDVSENTAEHKALLDKYEVFGPPCLLFFNRDGELMKDSTVVGFVWPDALAAHIRQTFDL